MLRTAPPNPLKAFFLLAMPVFALLAIGWNWRSAEASAAQTREVRIVSNNATAGQNVNVAVELVALGSENALGFSLNFNTAVLGNPTVALGSGAAGATLNVNTTQAGNGRVGIALALPIGQTFTAGTRQVVVVTFAVAGNAAAGTTSITFGDQPIAREISDANANTLTATYTPGGVVIQATNPVPVLTNLSPSSATAGSGDLTLTVNGSNFVASSVVRWNGAVRSTMMVNGGQLTALIPASDLAAAGTATIDVVNPAPGGGTSNGLAFTVNNPAPVITGLGPSSAAAGGAAFTLTVSGSGFVSGSTVLWNGSPRTTQFINANQLSASILQADIVNSGTASVTVNTPAPGGGTSAAVTFTITNQAPTITSLNPASAVAGGQAFDLTVNGSGFVNGSTVRWNGSARATQFVSSTQLTASIPASDIATAGTANVTVSNPDPGGGTSNSQSFTVNNPVPTVTAIAPNTATSGGSAFLLSVTGTNFVNSSTVHWNGSPRTTNFVSATSLSAQITVADLASAGIASITVVNPAPGGGTSNPVNFSVGQKPVTQISLDPASPNSNDAITIRLSGVWPDSCVPQNPQLTVNGNELRINASNLSQACLTVLTPWNMNAQVGRLAVGSYNLTVFHTSLSGQIELGKLSFNVNAPVASVSAASFQGNELAAESIVAAFGANLAISTEIATATPLPTTLAGTKVNVKDSAGVERLAPLFFVAPAQVNYLMPPGTAAGKATITITSGNNDVSVGTQETSTVAPGLFSANSNGQGVPAANVFRLKANGQQSTEPLAQFDSGLGRFVPTPIDLGPEGDQVFVVLFGTGFRNNAGLQNVSVQIGGTASEVLYAGQQGDFVGLDQCNARIPRSLIGRGEVDLVMTVDGKVANSVRISIK